MGGQGLAARRNVTCGARGEPRIEALLRASCGLAPSPPTRPPFHVKSAAPSSMVWARDDTRSPTRALPSPPRAPPQEAPTATLAARTRASAGAT
eukprot:scaffold35120_cov124-Isochrysis_galbana.AAC.2